MASPDAVRARVFSVLETVVLASMASPSGPSRRPRVSTMATEPAGCAGAGEAKEIQDQALFKVRPMFSSLPASS